MAQDQPYQERRRAFIRARHPDRGGDPADFIAGLHTLDAERERGPGSDPLPEVTVIRRQPWLARKAAATAQRLRHGPPPPRVRLPAATCA